MTNPHTFIAIYSGQTINSAKLVIASADPDLVQYVVANLLAAPVEAGDPVSAALEQGQRSALKVLQEGGTSNA
ncbi:MAG TPA: hypothetical protein VKU00_25640 [Chthonomonadaceae bacterium]|nr:hypothetical protein [Chthonomonadaceae bacterium]